MKTPIRMWLPIEITVTFYSGYSGGYAPGVTGTTFTRTYSYGDRIVIPEHDFVWEDHTITGWRYGDGSGGFGQYPEIVESFVDLVYGIDMAGAFTEGNTVELFPYWTANYHLLTVEFNGNGAETGTMSTYYVDSYSGANLPLNKFTREGYEFAGWNTEADGSGIEMYNGYFISGYDVEGDTVTLYAQWRIPETGDDTE